MATLRVPEQNYAVPHETSFAEGTKLFIRVGCRIDRRGQVLISPLIVIWDLRNSHMTRSPFHRWDEKAGLQRDAIRSQCSTCSRHKEKETGYEKD
jgi:hypothetical protein